MPQYYLIPKRVARAFPALGKAAQWLEAQLFRSVFWLVDRLSVERASSLAASIFGFSGRFSDKASKVKTNLEIAFPDKSEAERDAICRKIFRQLGVSAAELVKLEQIWRQHEERIEFIIDPAAQAHFANAGATVFVTAHVGAWQITTLISKYAKIPITTVYAAESNPYLHDLFYKLRSGFGAKLLPSSAGVRPLLKELNNGRSIGLAMDTRLDSGTLIPYFGVDALTNTSGARMALRTGAALIPIRADRIKPGRYRVTVEAPLVSSIPDATPEEQAIELSSQINQRFEAWIRETPEQWMCLKRRWPKAHKL